MTQSHCAIQAEGLRKVYAAGTDKEHAALDGFDLEVPTGGVYGLLGPNGAGKTTAVRIFTTLLRADAGRATVAGFDVVSEAADVRRSIGLVGQSAAVDEILNARQNLVMFGRLFRLGATEARRRADELLEQFGLADTGDKSVKHFSGGMRRRLDLAASLIMRPSVLFLDEPTTGLDPRGRGDVWDAVRTLVAGGTTVLLTTQYLDEADQLASRIAVMETGRVIAEGTPTELKTRVGGDQVDVVVEAGSALERDSVLERARDVVADSVGSAATIDADARTITAPVRDRARDLTEVLRRLQEEGVEIEDLVLRRPTLDDVFLTVTGHRAEGAVSAENGEAKEVAA